ncbi:MAG: DUF29 domain-containing protein [Cyanophyceae cyanobacterium]
MVDQVQRLYNTDFWLWIQQTAQQLQDREFDDVDWENLIEELEALGRNDKRAVVSNARIVILHLLKWAYEPQRRSRSWLSSIGEHRNRLAELFEESPSLQRIYTEEFEKAYQRARKQAVLETGLDIKSFPERSPFTSDEVLSLDFLPQ